MIVQRFSLCPRRPPITKFYNMLTYGDVYHSVIDRTFICINSVPKSASVVTPPVNTVFKNSGAWSFISLTNTITLRKLSSSWLKLWLGDGECKQSSLAFTTSSYVSWTSRSSSWATYTTIAVQYGLFQILYIYKLFMYLFFLQKSCD